MRFLFLGSGTSHGVPMIACDCPVCASDDPRNTRTRTAALARVGNVTILIDAPPDLRQQMLRHRVKRLDAILMTHAHADHLFGLDDVRAFCERHKAPIPLYGNEESLKIIRKNFDYVFRDTSFNMGWSIPRFGLHTVRQRANVQGVPVTAVPIRHGRWMILGYRIGGLAYLTDCSEIPEESMPLLTDLDTLVLGAIRHEPHPKHFTVSQAVKATERLRPRRAFLTHISHRLDHAATEAALPEFIRLAYDGLEIEVPDSPEPLLGHEPWTIQ